MKAGIVLSLTLMLGAILWLMVPGPGSLESAEQQFVVTAKHLHKVPALLNDPVWQQVQAVEVSVRGRGSFAEEEVMVTMKAAYTDDTLYFLFRWKDPTESVTKAAWRFDGEKWGHLEGDEDRLALLFEITRIKGFATKGCTVVCHSPPDVPNKEWKFATQSPAEKGDLWHWKAARSNPYHSVDDGWLTVAGNPSGSYRTTGRRADDGDGGDVFNESEDKSRPLYMQNPSVSPSSPGFLLYEEAVRIPEKALFKAGDRITYRMPKKPTGSRSDVKALGQYAEGGWTVMLYRRLDTGHDDDVVFDARKEYSFALALFDDSGDDHSKATKPMILRFGR